MTTLLPRFELHQAVQVDAAASPSGSNLRGTLRQALRISAALAFGLLVLGCTKAPEQQTPKSGVTYEIINKQLAGTEKASIDVRIQDRLSEEQLKALAQEIRAGLQGSYKRVFILYYLPGMTLGSGAWATTHYNPDMEVRILGATREQMDRLRTEMDEPIQGETLGTWIDVRPPITSRITISHHGVEWTLHQRFQDGSNRSVALRIEDTEGERRYVAGEGPRTVYYVVASSGHLEIRDQDGLISTAAPLK